MYSQQKTALTMRELSKKLINTENGVIWQFYGTTERDMSKYGLGTKIKEYYNYVLQFSKGQQVLFSNGVSAVKEGSYSDINVSRTGTFSIKKNNIIINFTKIGGAKYSNLVYWHEKSESLTLILQISGITDEKITLKQISGENIFENHAENAELVFTEYKPTVEENTANEYFLSESTSKKLTINMNDAFSISFSEGKNWAYTIMPKEGLDMINDDFPEIKEPEYTGGSIYGTYAKQWEFKPRKTGKYTMVFNNGVNQYTFKITVKP